MIEFSPITVRARLQQLFSRFASGAIDLRFKTNTSIAVTLSSGVSVPTIGRWFFFPIDLSLFICFTQHDGGRWVTLISSGGVATRA